MKTIKTLLLILPFVLLNTIGHAQFDMPKYNRIQEIKDLQPVVIINPPNPDIINKYDRKSKPEVVQTYEQLIGNYNEAMKIAMKNFWTFNSKEVLFKTRVELNDMLKDKSQRDKYFIIYCYSEETSYKRDFDWKINKGGEQVVGTYTHFAIGYPDEMPFYQVLLHHLLPSATDIGYFISNANYKFNYMLDHKDDYDIKGMVDKNAPILSRKTLLILQDDVSPKVINDIHNYYPCNIKLVADSEMVNEVMSGDSSFAYVIHSNGSTGKSGASFGSIDMNWVINCADGAILGYTQDGTDPVPFTTDQGLRKDFFQAIGNFCRAGKKR